jgi:uncharacterized protein (DUF4415 family)
VAEFAIHHRFITPTSKALRGRLFLGLLDETSTDSLIAKAMKKTAAKKTRRWSKQDVAKIRAEETAAGVGEEFKMPTKFKVLPKRRAIPAEAFEDKYTKVRITAYIDLDVLNYFKQRAAKDGTTYQEQINQELRSMERELAAAERDSRRAQK